MAGARFTPLTGEARDREVQRLEALPRRTPTTSRLLGLPLELPDATSFLWTIPDVVERGAYRFHSPSERPRILDGGAHIGLATLYFKSIFPLSRITAFEPDPAIFAMLEHNLAAWGWRDVELVRAALWSSPDELPFWSTGADDGRLLGADEPSTCRVATVRLRDLLAEPVDLLKLDVEGAEVELLRDCADRLREVRNLVVEYHSFVGREQELHALVGILCAAGFRLTIEAPSRDAHPLLGARVSNGKDGFVQVFARRED